MKPFSPGTAVPGLSPGLVQRFVPRLAQGISREPVPQLLSELETNLAQRLAVELAPSFLARLVPELDKILLFVLARGFVEGLLHRPLPHLTELARLPMLVPGFVPALDPGHALGLFPMLALVLVREGASFHSAGLVLAPAPGFASEIPLLFAQWIAAGIAK